MRDARSALVARLQPLRGLAVPPSEITARERELFQAHIRSFMAVNAVRAGLALVAFALAWWPLDAWLFAGQPLVVAGFAWFRGLLVGSLVVLYVVTKRTGWLAASPEVVATVGLVLGLSFCGWSMGRLLESSGSAQVAPWWQFLFIAPFLTVAILVPPRKRALVVASSVGSMVTAFLIAAPGHLRQPGLPASLSFLFFTCLLALAIGHAGYLLTLATFVHRERTAASEAQVRGLNDGLAATVAAQTQELRALAQRLETLREEERTWMAREIHDGLGQELAALRYALAYARVRAESAPDQAAQALGEVERLLARSGDSMRRIVGALRPRVLDELGLPAALRWLADDTARHSSLQCTAHIEPHDAQVPPAIALAAFRIAQEALSNAARHASATRVEIAASLRDGALRLTVSDDGVGLPEPLPMSPTALGITGIRERAIALGGVATWSRRAEGGTVVAVDLPVEARS